LLVAAEFVTRALQEETPMFYDQSLSR
jgi:hypothetical protein